MVRYDSLSKRYDSLGLARVDDAVGHGSTTWRRAVASARASIASFRSVRPIRPLTRRAPLRMAPRDSVGSGNDGDDRCVWFESSVFDQLLESEHHLGDVDVFEGDAVFGLEGGDERPQGVVVFGEAAEVVVEFDGPVVGRVSEGCLL